MKIAVSRASAASISFPGLLSFKKSPAGSMKMIVETTRLYARICAQIDPGHGLLKSRPISVNPSTTNPIGMPKKDLSMPANLTFQAACKFHTGATSTTDPSNLTKPENSSSKICCCEKQPIHLQHPQLQTFSIAYKKSNNSKKRYADLDSFLMPKIPMLNSINKLGPNAMEHPKTYPTGLMNTRSISNVNR